MVIKIHRSYRTVVALCDAELIGKKFEEGKMQLDIRENFYKDKEVSKDEAIKLLRRQLNEDSTFNIVGKESIQSAIEAGLITKRSVHKIQNITFTLILI